MLWLFAMLATGILPEKAYAQYLRSTDSLAILSYDSAAYRVYLLKPDSAVSLAGRALDLAREGGFHALEGYSCFILSKAYWAKANYRLSAEYGFKAIEILENSPHTNILGKSLLSVARTFIDLQDHQQGAKYIEAALRLARNTGDRWLLAEGFREKSMLFSETKVYDSGLFYADEALKLFEQKRDTINISILYGRKAKIYFYRKDYDRSAFYNRRSLLLDSLGGNRRALGITYYQAALLSIHTDKMDSAIVLLKKSISISEEIRNLATLIKAHSLLGGIHRENKNNDLAYRELKIASLYKDTLYNAEQNGQIQEMQSLYELSSKEHTIEQLAQDNLVQQRQVENQRWFVGFLLLCVVLLGVVIFFLTRFRRLQDRTNTELASKNIAIEQQKEEIQSQAETLQHLNDLKSKLFSVISHDLRGPMATLHSLLDLLTRQKLSPDEFISVSDKLKNSLDVTERTLENLLNWSLSQMEGIRTESRPINISHVITEATNLMREVAHRKDIRLIHEVDKSLVVSADSNQVHLILRNIIHNAIKFSNPHQDVFISAVKEMDFCVITVSDSGIGMSEEEIQKLLHARDHFTKAGTMQEKGTGLGLLLCREFIKLNGGDMTIQSHPNRGTRVIFTLPLKREFAGEIAVPVPV